MVLLANEPWIQASRVDEVVGMDKGAVSRSARFLAKRGLVMMRRNEFDPRRREMALTEAGEYLHDQIVDIALTRESRLMAGISAKEREILIKLLKKMEANLDALDASALDPFKGVQRRDDGPAASGSASWRKSRTRTASS